MAEGRFFHSAVSSGILGDFYMDTIACRHVLHLGGAGMCNILGGGIDAVYGRAIVFAYQWSVQPLQALSCKSRFARL